MALLGFLADRVAADHADVTDAERQVLVACLFEDAKRVWHMIDQAVTLGRDAADLGDAAAMAFRQGDLEAVHVALALLENDPGKEGSDEFRRDLGIAVREARAETAMLQGRPDEAIHHWSAGAACYGEPKSEQDLIEVAKFRSLAVHRLMQFSEVFGGDGSWLPGAVDLCYANMREAENPWDAAACRMQLGGAQLTAGKLKSGTDAQQLFMDAEYTFRIATWEFDKDLFPEDWAEARNAQGLACAHLAFESIEDDAHTPGRTGGYWSLAEGYYVEALQMQADIELRLPWAKTSVNLGFLLLHRARVETGERAAECLDNAVIFCERGQEIMTREAHPSDWVGTQRIIIEALIARGDLGSSETEPYYPRALKELNEALDFLETVDWPVVVEEVERLRAMLEDSGFSG
ncbi:MAG: hypothetical protein OXU72_07465 [Gammaproteobacteria bacterium]|nr:hypothetical protein [Gammaproteobacteria bacterium]